MKIFFRLALMASLTAALVTAYFFLSFPRVEPLGTISLPDDPVRLENGRYLAEHVAMCVECHSTRDWSRYAGPVVDGSEGAGGEKFTGGFGTLYAPNITPSGIGTVSDQDLYQAVAAGVKPNGQALFPLMPYPHYGQMDREDLEDILAYIRSLTAKENVIPPSELVFPLNLLVRTMPNTPQHQARPPKDDTVAYGKYLFRVASCADCHSPQNQGKAIPGMDLAGGFELETPWGKTIRSSNITPHKTGLGAWSKERFVGRFKNPEQPHNKGKVVAEGEFNTLMPWSSYSGMTSEDLGAIYDYLRTVTPVDNAVKISD